MISLIKYFKQIHRIHSYIYSWYSISLHKFKRWSWFIRKLSTELALKYFHQRNAHIYIRHSANAYLVPFQRSTMDFFLQKISIWTLDRALNPPYFDMTTGKLHMIIQKKGMSFGRIHFNQSKGVINPRLPQILVNVGFQTYIFYGFILPGNLVS